MKGDIVVWMFDNYLWILAYLIIGGFLCTIFSQYCPTMTKKQQRNFDKVNEKTFYLNRIDIIENKVFFIIALIVIGIIYLIN
jgi:hypothetical protein